jgi:hypothetical protein
MLLFRQGTYFARTATFVNEKHTQLVSKSRGTLKHAPLGISVHSNQKWTRDVALSARYVLCQNSDFCKRKTQATGMGGAARAKKFADRGGKNRKGQNAKVAGVKRAKPGQRKSPEQRQRPPRLWGGGAARTEEVAGAEAEAAEAAGQAASADEVAGAEAEAAKAAGVEARAKKVAGAEEEAAEVVGGAARTEEVAVAEAEAAEAAGQAASADEVAGAEAEAAKAAGVEARAKKVD